MTDRFICSVCKVHLKSDEFLEAPHPFESGETLYGCPKCKSLNSEIGVCDEQNCWKPSTCGTPTPKGYRRTCGEHVPDQSEKEE